MDCTDCTDGKENREFAKQDLFTRVICGSVLSLSGARALPFAPFRGNAQPAIRNPQWSLAAKKRKKRKVGIAFFVPFEPFRGQSAIRNPQSSHGSAAASPCRSGNKPEPGNREFEGFP
jgi:hypothetical protein